MENKQLRRVDWINLQLPSLQDFARFTGWATGRACFSGWLFCLSSIRVVAKFAIALVDQTEKATHNLLDIYNQLPHCGVIGGKYIDVNATPVTEEKEIITDIVGAIEGKQVMLIGEMGTGKSTLAQYLAYTVGGTVKVYECEGTPDDWIGLEVIGKGEDWGAIEDGMQADLEDLSNQLKIRMEHGDNALNGSQKVIICEEYPELVNKVPSSGEWLERHARRGRKARRFTILLSQYDRVSAWGLEGKADLGEAFYRIRLGKKAVSHAKSLKDDSLVDWLRSDRSHCLLDDNPCKLPSYREMKSVTQRLLVTAQISPVKTAEPPQKSLFQPFSEEVEPSEKSLKKVVKVCLEAGFSDSKIIKDILGYQGGNYQNGKKILEELKQ